MNQTRSRFQKDRLTPSDRTEIRLVVFDVNGTLIRENTWYDLNLAMGMTAAEDMSLMTGYLHGDITYIESQKQLEEYYLSRGQATRRAIEQVVCAYTYAPYARAAAAYLRQAGYELALITGAMRILAGRVAEDLQIRYFAANNRFRFDRTGRLVSIETTADDTVFKLQALKKICRRLHVRADQVAVIGDGENDRLLFRYTGHGITFPGSTLATGAWKIIPDLSELLRIL